MPMSVADVAPPKLKYLDEVLDRLGGVALDRIRVHPPMGTATVDDVVEIQERENRLFELVEGILIEKIMGYTESQIAARLIIALGAYADAHDLGVVTGEGGMFRLPENLVRIPDVAFASWDQFPEHELPNEAVPEIVPDLAVEVISEGNTQAEMTLKLQEYFDAGSTLVWFIDPKRKTVTAYSSPTRSKMLAVGDVLEGGKLLPGFSMQVADLFKNIKPARKRRK